MSNFQKLVRFFAEEKFGAGNEEAISKWVGYWTDTLSRNLDLVSAFRTRTQIDFKGKRVLDIGCGTGGLSQLVSEEGGYYIGSDYFPAILKIAGAFISDLPRPDLCGLVRASGMAIPFADATIDVVVAFDVIEHLEGGWDWQLSFMKEIRRILRPGGVLILTTPNRLYPFEGHTFMYGPQYLPVWLADKYIRWKNPNFLQEYKTYGHVKLLGPWKMKKLVDSSGLQVIHDLPYGMDYGDYPRKKRSLLKLLSLFGAGWGYTTGFWFSAGRKEDFPAMKNLRKKEWLRG